MKVNQGVNSNIFVKEIGSREMNKRNLLKNEPELPKFIKQKKVVKPKITPR